MGTTTVGAAGQQSSSCPVEWHCDDSVHVRGEAPLAARPLKLLLLGKVTWSTFRALCQDQGGPHQMQVP